MTFARKCSPGLWLSWHCGVAVAIVAISTQLRIGKSLTASSAEHLVFLAQLVVAHLGCVAVLAWRTRERRAVNPTEIALTILAFFGSCALLLLVRQAYYSPFLLLVALVLAGLAIALSLILTPRILVPLGVGLALGAGALQPFQGRPKEILDIALGAVPKPGRTQAIIGSAMYSMRATFYDNYFDVCSSAMRQCDTPRNGGGLSEFSDGYLLATGEGLLHFFSVDSTNAPLKARRLRYVVPLNSDAYLQQGPKEELRVFRVMDILVREQGKNFTLFAAHHYWKLDQKCSVLRISRLEGETAAFLAGEMEGDWETLFESTPCLPLKYGPHGRAFAGEESGGRMAMLDERTLLLTVGDLQFDGWNSTEILAQDENKDYGKTLTIDIASGKSEVFTWGHRNPQGLYVAPDNTIWSTEHGPKGGDELNRLVKGTNYGWPLVTYGTEYGMKEWPPNKTPGDHSGFALPVFAWVPSIAVSNLIGVQSKLFPLWRNDLLICSYSQSLSRARIRDGRVVTLEPIEVRRRNGRLRDILEDRDGRIVLLMDGGSVAFLEPVLDGAGQAKPANSLERGALLFSACAACHKVGNGTLHAIGPDLAAIVGRSIGTATGFSYSEAMKKQAGEWSEARLNEFLSSPQKRVPGTTMQFAGIEKPEDRADLIAYLKTLKPL